MQAFGGYPLVPAFNVAGLKPASGDESERVRCPFCWTRVAWSGMLCHLDRSVTCQEWQQHVRSGATSWAKPAAARPWECAVCGRKFKTQWDLTQHEKMSHPESPPRPLKLTSAVRGRSEPAARHEREGRGRGRHGASASVAPSLPSVHSAPAFTRAEAPRVPQESQERRSRGEEESEDPGQRRSRRGSRSRQRQDERRRRRVERRNNRSIRRRAEADPEEGEGSQNRRERTFADLVAMGTKIFGSGSGQGQ